MTLLCDMLHPVRCTKKLQLYTGLQCMSVADNSLHSQQTTNYQENTFGIAYLGGFEIINHTISNDQQNRVLLLLLAKVII